MRRSTIFRARTILSLMFSAAAMLVPSAAATPATVDRLQPLSVGTPIPFGCDPLIEYEPVIAVNPARPHNVVAAWIQGLALSPNAIVASVSQDAGATWEDAVVSGLSGCTGADADTVAEDPRLAFNRDGSILYLVSLRFSWERNAERILVTRSGNGGETWSQPVTIDDQSPLNGETWVTADPRLRDRAYVAWTEKVVSPQAWESYLAVTDDGGATWDQALLYDPPAGVLPISHVLRVAPNTGRLVDVFLQVDTRPESEREEDAFSARCQIRAISSETAEGPWSQPVRIAETSCARPSDPDTGFDVFANATPTLDMAADGTAYVAWHDLAAGEPAQIEFSRSVDGGRSWTRPSAIARDPRALAFQPTLAVGPRGVVGVTYYDLRNDRTGDGELTVDVFFSHSHDRGRSWEEVRLAGPFDGRAAPLDPTPLTYTGPDGVPDPSQPAYGVGCDCYGLVGVPDGFAAAFMVAAPLAPEPSTDIFFAHLTVPQK
jgi:hypothetical protein